MSTQRPRALGLAFVLEFLLSLIPLIVLGSSIGWPASLAFPADQILPLIQAHWAEVRLGYGAYLLYSIAFFPLIVWTASSLESQKPWGPTLVLASGLAALSVLARAIGILRWLAPAPALAAWYSSGGADAAAATGVFNVLNAYGGSIGEALGIGLFGGGSLLMISVALLTQPRSPRWLGWWTLATALAQLLTLLPLAGLEGAPVTTIAAMSLMSWLLALGIRLLVTRRDLNS